MAYTVPALPSGARPRRILLHVCCAPCASHCIGVLRDAGMEVTAFFTNANIAPEEERLLRLENVRKLAAILGVPLVEEAPPHADWQRAVAGFESAPEGGGRCRRCFALNLGRTRDYAAAHGFEAFATSLTVSPHKNSATVFEVGRALDPVRFLPVDFKKNGGFQHSVELSRRYGLYRQAYCGCEFSLRPASAR
ncbi:MAG: epoxyqueuosine reductase QueH [Kiritimatiellia bacterium]|jgi:predicted adenine nucleotide alpha hydrolase (AANH) superfamily ATPase